MRIEHNDGAVFVDGCETLAHEFDDAQLEPDVDGGVDIAVLCKQGAHGGVGWLVAVADERAEVVEIGKALERGVEIVLDEGGVGGAKICRSSKVA